MRKWKIEDSEELYNIKGWGIDFFNINDKGTVCVSPVKDGPQINLTDLITELSLRDVSTPILLRFSDILRNRIENISQCFKNASEEYEFKGDNILIYPIKVNQMKPVVEEILSHGEDFNIGLEAGSKPELHAVLGLTSDPDSLVICNGYKDEDFIELALLAQKMGRTVIIVVEKLNELKLTIEIARRLNVKPNIGIRIKLSSSGSGMWESSGGDVSKFGLNSSELLEALDYLKENNAEEYFKLIHFHIGSQVTKIRRIKNALREVSQFYVQLSKMGFDIKYVDVGGGLGVDYDGSRSGSNSSINYSIQEYVNDIVFYITDVCEKNNLKHPDIITESGRSLTAHHSVLVFDVLETTSQPRLSEDFIITDEHHDLIKELYSIYDNLTKSGMLEAWHDAQQIREEALDRFSLGLLDLETRGLSERLFWTIARELYELTEQMKHTPDEFRDLRKMLADKYFCNFSLFQSLPDSWAIDQIFPIMPLQRLGEKPSNYATLQDITCDSDGKIDHFIGPLKIASHLPIHKIKEGEKYYIGVFLVGAYQEILGDLHNLFGDTNVVHIAVDDDSYVIKQIIDGETVEDVLGYVQYSGKKLVRSLEKWVSKSVQAEKITVQEGKEFLSNYKSGLYGYTYLT